LIYDEQAGLVFLFLHVIPLDHDFLPQGTLAGLSICFLKVPAKRFIDDEAPMKV